MLDLDETLIHFDEKQLVSKRLTRQNSKKELGFNIRPFAQKFLKALCSLYEIVIFTAADQEYADEVIDRLDKHKCISYRLYRQHTTQLVNKTTQ